MNEVANVGSEYTAEVLFFLIPLLRGTLLEVPAQLVVHVCSMLTGNQFGLDLVVIKHIHVCLVGVY